MKTHSAAAVLLLLVGCSAPSSPASSPDPLQEADGLTRARIAETVVVGGPKVTPLAVLEDSRCPLNARCVWAGRVRLQVRVHLGSGSALTELTQGHALPVADGTLELVEVQPEPIAGAGSSPIAASDYRFGFRFMGGL